ncbi:hypothetical protein PN419_17950 [Halorubrum ezzemoulense]|uniref:hypothetical protein n=1 Tax=Halorubrum ezzemoulense TaxID=337243 RepID=UPI00232D793C|nr:hypothetical protein [Halorubrum ezzemoulense]MDB9250854.1 hypothetical protein [Halorubrum ezzemoulense]MDB9261025.1 hypothetical protein [Halorubrum ezzemoulense]MDB9264423.1 hypothetical protein [Halorubrum ezzemoulense]MDB9267902.1 hypothetical protein [Halorubrum ezzemoulense]MDB9271386.1 hypothetical protein [Halorubrum ezzemoulense]
MSNNSWTWNTDREPNFSNMSTIGIPSDDVVRDVAQAARSLDVEDTRVSDNTHGLAPASVVLDQLLFDVPSDALRPEVIDGEIVFTVAAPLEVEGRERDGAVRVRVRADADTYDINSVDVVAQVA